MAESFPKITLMLEQARNLTIEAAVSALTRLLETPSAKRPHEISKLLNSRVERDVLNGMKCVVALMSRGEDGAGYFADVVKNVTLQNARVRALVMIYIQKYAEHEPDTALLLINLIQKALGEKRPGARAASIRTLGGIRIPEIASLLALCIKRTAFDLLPQVRAATAMAIGKAFDIEGINQLQLAAHLADLLGDALPAVIGAAIKVFAKLKPQLVRMLAKKAWAPIHANFRRYTRLLRDMDEWSACALIDVLAEYSRLFIARPQLVLPNGSRVDLPDDLADFPDAYTFDADPDIDLLVAALAPFAYTSSEVVVLAALRALVLVGTPELVVRLGYARVLTKMATQPSGSTSRLYALQMVLLLAQAIPAAFQASVKKYYLSLDDATPIATCKIQILLALFAEPTAKLVMQELQYNAVGPRQEIAREAVRALGNCSQMSALYTEKVLRWCTEELVKPSAMPIFSELLTVVRYLLQQKQSAGADQQQLVRTVYKLSLVLQNPELQLDPDAKASLIWIIGEFSQPAKNLVGPDVLRLSLKQFAYESQKVRYELLNLAAKAYLFEMLERPNSEDVAATRVEKMFHYVLNLARYDPSVIIRDKARMLEQLLQPSNHQLAILFLQVPKNPPIMTKSYNTLHPVLGRYFEKIAWADPHSLPPKTIRKELATPPQRYTGIDNGTIFGAKKSSPSIASQTVPAARKTNQLQSLDEFFGDDDDDEESESELSEAELLDAESDSEASEFASDSSGEDGSSLAGDQDSFEAPGGSHRAYKEDFKQVVPHASREKGTEASSLHEYESESDLSVDSQAQFFR